MDSVSQSVASLLRSRGIEVTPDQVNVWLGEMTRKWNRRHVGPTVTEEQIAWAILGDHFGLTICLHLHFGYALED